MADEMMDFNFSTDPTKIIKVIGVGGGGVNAVDYMYKNGIKGVSFAVCNTDAQSFNGVNVPVKVTLGEGLGAGGNPDKAKEEFEKSRAEVEKLLNDNTKMVFVATGMGGGTGSGAGPLLAKMAKDKGILTVGIVTIPFLFELVPRIIQAIDAVKEMSKNVDALIVINNERLKTYYPAEEFIEAFKKPNEVLAMAVKSIIEVITVKGIINRDFNDVKTTMKDGGVALVSYGFGKGENRLDDAIQEALDSPLLSNNDIYNAKRVLFYISIRPDAKFKNEEMTQVDIFMHRFDRHIKTIWGIGVDDSLLPEQEIKFTIIATGFGMNNVKRGLNDIVIKGLEDRDFIEIQNIAETKIKNEGIVGEFYEDFNPDSNPKIKRFSQSSIIVLTVDELDDDTLIDFMEKNPTYNRDAKAIVNIRKPAKNNIRNETSVVKTDSSPEQTIISFF